MISQHVMDSHAVTANDVHWVAAGVLLRAKVSPWINEPGCKRAISEVNAFRLWKGMIRNRKGRRGVPSHLPHPSSIGQNAPQNHSSMGFLSNGDFTAQNHSFLPSAPSQLSPFPPSCPLPALSFPHKSMFRPGKLFSWNPQILLSPGIPWDSHIYTIAAGSNPLSSFLSFPLQKLWGSSLLSDVETHPKINKIFY